MLTQMVLKRRAVARAELAAQREEAMFEEHEEQRVEVMSVGPAGTAAWLRGYAVAVVEALLLFEARRMVKTAIYVVKALSQAQTTQTALEKGPSGEHTRHPLIGPSTRLVDVHMRLRPKRLVLWQMPVRAVQAARYDAVEKAVLLVVAASS